MEPYNWEQPEGLPEEAPLGRLQLDPLAEPTEFEGMECAFCDARIPVYLEGDQIVALYQILISGGAPYLCCEDCFSLACKGARREQITSRSGVSTLYAQ